MLTILLCATLMRVAFAATTGLGNDESYAVVTSRVLALSYFDHPPMTWWLVHLSVFLTGSEAPLVVRAPFLVFAALSTVLMYRLTARLFTPWAGVLAALMMACAPVLGVTSASWVLPDGPLIAFLLAGTLVLARVLFEPDAHPAGWLLAGLLGGLAMLSKYHGAFFFIGTFVFLLTSPDHRFWLRRAWPYAGALVALAVFAPVVVWNAQNDFVSLAFQGGRAAAARFQPWMSLVVIGGGALFLTPWIWVGLVGSGWRALRANIRAPRSWLLLCLGCGPILLFPLIAAWSPSKPFFHWAAPGYLMLFPLLGRAMARRWTYHAATRRWAFGSAAFVGVAMGAIMILSLVPTLSAIGAGPPRDPLRELAAWSDLDDQFRQLGLTPDRYPLVVSRIWHEGGKIGYALGDRWPIACIGQDCRGFRFTHMEQGREGADAVVVVSGIPRAEEIAVLASHFARLETVSTFDLRHAGALIGPATILIGHSYHRDGETGGAS
ncbi:glycosyltransferase family 39 protein [Xanthobacter autotrophicus DSM 431]|uniref:glycosyltransferase family 39 protein n=1 Tax=Xanthobacter nonsaccharivorans TaxID=3119912 RepID=UPI00372851A7